MSCAIFRDKSHLIKHSEIYQNSILTLVYRLRDNISKYCEKTSECII